MKRIIVLALAACMVLGAAFGASAAEFKTSGMLYMGYDYVNQDNDANTNQFSQRFRTQIDIVSSEALSGTVYFEIDNKWGDEPTGGELGTDGVEIETRRAYITFMMPSTSVQVRAGLQGLSLPGAVAGSPVLADDVAAITATGAVAGANVTAFFARPYDNGTEKGQIDLFGAVVSADLGMVSASPYFVFTNNGSDSTHLDGNEAQWYGLALEAAPMADLTLSFDGIYGSQDSKDGGFLVAGKAAYAMDFATPAVLGWYASGNDKDGEGILPTIDGKDFVPTTFVGWGAAAASSDAIFGDALGKWGVSLQLSDISYIEKLSHTVRATYMRGTNDDANASTITAWSDDDSAYEFDFVSTYAVYENLDFIVDLAYAGTDFDNDSAASSIDNIFKAAAGIQYNF